MDSSIMEIGFKMFVGLGIVLITFGAAIFVAKKFFGKGLSSLRKGVSSRSSLELEVTKVIGHGRNLHVVKFGNKTLLLGSTNTSVNFLSSFEADDSGDEASDFDRLLDHQEDTRKDDSIKQQIGSRLREIARI